MWFGDRCQNVNVYTVRMSFRLRRRQSSFIKVLLCLDLFFFPFGRDFHEKAAAVVTWSFEKLCTKRIPGAYSFVPSFPIIKVESALPNLWKFPTTPRRRITTKSSNNCWKPTTHGQSSSSPVKKTYGEERSGTIWSHACFLWRAAESPRWGVLISEQQVLKKEKERKKG